MYGVLDAQSQRDAAFDNLKHASPTMAFRWKQANPEKPVGSGHSAVIGPDRFGSEANGSK